MSNTTKVTALYGGSPPTQSAARSGPSVGASASTAITEWLVRIRLKQFELGGSGSVLVFLGPLPDVISEWYLSPYFVGAVDVYADSHLQQSENRQGQRDIEVQGFVHFNDYIAKKSGLGSFDPKVVVPYLKRVLNWQVVKADYTPVDVCTLPSLQVAVFSAPLRLEPGGKFPTLGELHHYHEITENRDGGCRCRDNRGDIDD